MRYLVVKGIDKAARPSWEILTEDGKILHVHTTKTKNVRVKVEVKD